MHVDREDGRGLSIIIIFIDNMLIIGKEEAIDAAIKVLQCHFQVKDPTSFKIIWAFKLCKVMMARKPSFSTKC